MSNPEKKLQRLAPPIDAVTLMNIEGILQKTLNNQEAMMPEGLLEPIEPISVGDQEVSAKPVHGPWFSVVIANDGPDDVLATVNSETNAGRHRVVAHESYTVDMKRAIIKDVVMKCEPGKSASVRLVGTR